jgi:hypothetical protein
MKPYNHCLRTLKITVCIFILACPVLTRAQLPDCSSGTVMYGIFNDSLGSGVNSPSEIRSVNYATGAIGPLMGGTSFTIKTSSGSAFYGSAALGVDIITNRFYVVTQMSSGASRSKEIYTINTVTNTMTKIGTTPASVDFHHIVKMGISPSVKGYAIGVGRDTSGAAATFNPLIRFTTCGATPTTNCSTVDLLGYLPVAPGMTRWDLFNGDIAFDNAGNLYFATVSYGAVSGSGGTGRYKDARLFKINAADIPAVAGTGTIPMSLVADYNSLDSTVMNGIAFDPAGAMYFATRKFTGIQVSPYVNQLYKSPAAGTANIIPGFAPITPGYSIADLASCYFPLTILPNELIELSASNSGGQGQLKFKSFNNLDVIYYEVMRSTGNPENFEVIERIQPTGNKAETSYSVKDANTTPGVTYYYKIRSIMPDGKRLYSNVAKISFSNAIGIELKPWPNPFSSQLEFKLETKGPQSVTIRILNEQGRTVKVQEQALQRGVNRIVLENLSQLKKGIYILEVAGATDKVMDKIVKF